MTESIDQRAAFAGLSSRSPGYAALAPVIRSAVPKALDTFYERVRATPETRRFFRHAIQPATFAVQPATRTRKCQRERHIPHHVRNLENEITEPNANRLIAQYAIVHCERRRHRMA